MNRVYLDDLALKATAAEQDEWRWDGGVLEGKRSGQVVLSADIGRYDTDEPKIIVSVSNAAHISANGPLVTLALIARIRELENVLERSADVIDEFVPGRTMLSEEIRALLERGAVTDVGGG